MNQSTEETRLADICGQLFLFLTTFRRTASKDSVDFDTVRNQLLDIFSEQERQAQRQPQLATLYKEATYPLVALTDEILLDTPWSGRDDWEVELLELHYFSTAVAGEEFFQRLTNLEAYDDQLAEIYFLCLSLGFRGAYRSRPDERKQMQQMLYSRLPQRIAKKSEAICPGVYDHNVERDMTKLPVIGAVNIGVCLAGAIALALLASNVVTREILDELLLLARSVVGE